jgi:hypothetical protein
MQHLSLCLLFSLPLSISLSLSLSLYLSLSLSQVDSMRSLSKLSCRGLNATADEGKKDESWHNMKWELYLKRSQGIKL